MFKVMLQSGRHVPRLATRLEEQEPDALTPAWVADVANVEEEGLALAVEALHRHQCDVAAAQTWLMYAWRSRPDERERAIRAEAIATVHQIAPRIPTLGAGQTYRAAIVALAGFG